MRVIYPLLLLGVLSCNASKYNLKQEGKFIFLNKGNSTIDSVLVFSDVYSKYQLVGNTIYYVDNLKSPDRINLKLFKSDIEGDKLLPSENISLKSFDLNYDKLIKVKFKRESLVLKYESRGDQTIEVYKIDSLFNQ